ncbi:MAG: DNA-binding response OmpR family regulator [Myxococcota bacterium]|jgi:DNA-binding response OmpR family regulator
MATILIIDDDRSVRDMLAMALEDAGHDALTAPDGIVGERRVAALEPDLVVSDVNMPGLDGFSLCRRIRDSGNAVPIILLTARDGEIDEALGLELGADDYVTKPFSTRVLLARITALLRREQARASQDARAIEVGMLRLDSERMEASWRGTTFRTTVTEFRLLQVLAGRPGVVYSRELLLERIRGDDSVVAERLIDTYIRRLRRSIERIDDTFAGIETVIGAGYRWHG